MVELPAVIIASPADERFITDATLDGHIAYDRITVRARTWANDKIRSAVVTLEGHTVPMAQIPQSTVWQAVMERKSLADGVYKLTVTIADKHGLTAEDSIRLVVGAAAYALPKRSERDQDNAVEAWPERALLGTQLGPNKNGRKW